MTNPTTINEEPEGWWQPHWYLSPRPSTQSIITWWEKRRLAYNVLLFLWGVGNFFVVAAWSLRSIRIMHYDGAAYFCGSIIIIQILSNVWYTGGWIVEWLLQKISGAAHPSFGPHALLAGTIFSFLFAEYFYWSLYRIYH